MTTLAQLKKMSKEERERRETIVFDFFDRLVMAASQMSIAIEVRERFAKGGMEAPTRAGLAMAFEATRQRSAELIAFVAENAPLLTEEFSDVMPLDAFGGKPETRQ